MVIVRSPSWKKPQIAKNSKAQEVQDTGATRHEVMRVCWT